MYDVIRDKLGLSFNILPARSGGMNWSEGSEISHIHTTSTFTATAWEVGHGIQDLSISAFYHTPERSAWTEFVAPYQIDSLRIFAPALQTKTFT